MDSILGNIVNDIDKEIKRELTMLTGALFSELVWKLPKDLSYEEYYYIFENIVDRCNFQMVDILKKTNDNKES